MIAIFCRGARKSSTLGLAGPTGWENRQDTIRFAEVPISQGQTDVRSNDEKGEEMTTPDGCVGFWAVMLPVQ